ncbi:MAG TPA: hypothetical protein VJN88_05985 [Ktedonobacterales bacterium]|nr:hypothetical protein [Ktedonobacterales bacterium]
MGDTSNERQSSSGPFEHEREVTADPAAMRDDISAAQTDARAAARLSGEHEERLLYEPGYNFDPRGGEGALYYPSADVSGETQDEQSG